MKILKGFSKLSAQEKRRLAVSSCQDPEAAAQELASFLHPDQGVRELLEGISENTISSYPLPYNVAPNFIVNGHPYMVPMVTEESSVVAAASSAARFWAVRGGFRAEVKDDTKGGQLHFLFTGNTHKLKHAMPAIDTWLRQFVKPVTQNMEKRGGGIRQITLKDRTEILDHYYQLHADFDTRDAMGANFINSCLEEFAEGLKAFFREKEGFDEKDFEPVMAILSNYNDRCVVRVSVSCTLDDLEGAIPQLNAGQFVRRFQMAVKIAEEDVYRATTHNKGIMNGVDAVILATGNDFRAIEAGAHAWAARSGQYRSLSHAVLKDDLFTFSLEMPMALGTIGGLTRLHPLAARSMEILGNPDARQLMMIAAAAGLANNFAAVRSLTTTGIQAGHMRMHLSNIIMQLKATPAEAKQIEARFRDQKVSYQAVSSYLEKLRSG